MININQTIPDPEFGFVGRMSSVVLNAAFMYNIVAGLNPPAALGATLVHALFSAMLLFSPLSYEEQNTNSTMSY